MKRARFISKWSAIGLAVTLAFLSSAAIPHESKTHEFAQAAPVGVSMVELLATPQHYDGRSIRTQGFVCIEFEDNALYFHEEDWRHGLTKNSFTLRLSESQRKEFRNVNRKYAVVEGTVYANGPERRDIWSGAIGDITRLEAWTVHR